MKMTPLGAIELNIPRWGCTAHMISLLLQPWCGISMQMQGTQWDPHGLMLSKRVIMRPGQDSHTIMQHVTAPHQKKPSRVTWWRPDRASGLQESCSSNLHNPSCGPSWKSGRQYYTRVGATTKQTTHTRNAHKQVLHGLLRHVPYEFKEWQPLYYCCLSFFQCNFGFPLLNKKIPAPNHRIQLHHAAPKVHRPDNRSTKFIQWSKSGLKGHR